MRELFITDAPAATVLVRVMTGSVALSEGIQKFLYPADLAAGRHLSYYRGHRRSSFYALHRSCRDSITMRVCEATSIRVNELLLVATLLGFLLLPRRVILAFLPNHRPN
jgi:hypothetical protein